jgi:hypothetical protein
MRCAYDTGPIFGMANKARCYNDIGPFSLADSERWAGGLDGKAVAAATIEDSSRA